MPSVTYMNQSAPFWDFVANLEQQGRNHPAFANNPNNNEHADEGHPFGPWGWGFSSRDLPHRGPPPPSGSHSQEHHSAKDSNEKADEKAGEKDDNINDNNNGEGPSKSGSDSEECSGRRGRCGRQHGHGHGPGPRGQHGHGPHGRGGFGPHRHWGGRGGWGPWSGRGGPFGGQPWNPLNFAAGFFDPSANQDTNNKNNSNEIEDFTPEADIFDTTSSFIIHVSLPGAKKEDVGVNWDAEKSELSIAGVIYRPDVDEEMLKTLATSERRTGPFERKVRLGTRANPAQIDAEGIAAKLEDGVLRVEVPKLAMEFVEVRKVDIE